MAELLAMLIRRLKQSTQLYATTLPSLHSKQLAVTWILHDFFSLEVWFNRQINYKLQSKHITKNLQTLGESQHHKRVKIEKFQEIEVLDHLNMMLQQV